MKARLALSLLALCSGAIPSAASAAVFGTNPVNISVGSGGEAPNGPSGHPSISGDDRTGSITAFDSQASNLVGGDNNGQSDIFVWHRPPSAPGEQGQSGEGSLELVSKPGGGGDANGPSTNPSVDGSLNRAPHCVAYESRATNLAAADTSRDSDIYVRSLSGGNTTLVSGGVTGDATNPVVKGDCSQVAFQAGGSIWKGSPRGGNAKKFAPGADPAFAIDGSAFVWTQGGSIKIDRNKGGRATVGRGTHPMVSGRDPNGWLVAFQGSGGLVKSKINTRGRAKRDVFPGSLVAGVTAFAATRGIVTYAQGNTLFYLNLHSGNSDDVAVAEGGITEASAGARGNFEAFTATGGDNFVGPTGQPAIWFKSLPQ